MRGSSPDAAARYQIARKSCPIRLLRDRFQNEWRAPDTEEPHQMFGIGRDLHGYLECWDRHLLLFQATFDTIMDWEWGDLGVIQFFITPADLAARNWDGIRCSYTCG